MKRILWIISLVTILITACGGAESASTAPDFTLPNALGGDVSLSDYTGQPVFLFFHMAVG